MKRDLAELARVGHYVAGMPQLCWNGLSENWLLKECGHRHWLAMADQQGQAQPEFADAQGRKVYAAFTFIRTSDAALYAIQEHTRFLIVTRHCDTGRAQNYSRHEVIVEGRCVARVEMLSAFIRRDCLGDNRSVVRAALDRSVHALASSAVSEEADLFVQHARTRRAAAACPQRQEASDKLLASVFTPCPNGDFNGAALLYFSSFPAIVDRTEWEHRHALQLPFGARFALQREVTFKGNLNLGDTLHIRMQCEETAHRSLSHQCQLLRQSDGAPLAEVTTAKAFFPG